MPVGLTAMTAAVAMMLLMGATPSAALQFVGSANTSDETLVTQFGQDGTIAVKVPEMASDPCDIVYVFKEPYCGYTAECEDADHCRFAYIGNGLTADCGSDPLPAAGSWVIIPNIQTLADGKYYAGFSRAGNFGPLHTGAASHWELIATNFTLQSGSVIGDPHVENMANERFEIRAAGHHKLVQIPRVFTSNNETPLMLRIDAEMAHLIEDNCNGTFITNITIWGNWTGEFGRMDISVGSDAPSTPMLINKVEAPHYVGHYHSPKATYEHNSVSFVLGSTAFHVAKHYEGRYGKQRGFLNFRATGLRTYFDVGGLLGYDNHSYAEVPPPECVAQSTSKTAPASGMSLIGRGRTAMQDASSLPILSSASQLLVVD